MSVSKVLFVQLAVGDPSRIQAAGNVPLAAACLIQAARESGRYGDVDFLLLPETIADHGSTSAVVRTILAEAPDAVGFSLFLWNLETSLETVHRLRASGYSGFLFAGGPEVVPGQKVMDNPEFDAFVEGEGEEPFLALLADIEKGSPKRHYRGSRGSSFGKSGNPYDSGILKITPSKAVFLETVRGCPNGCGYCYYGKAFDSVTPKAIPPVVATFAKAVREGARDIYLLDPEFNARPDADDLLLEFASLNAEKVSLHAELRLERVTETQAELLARAGVVSVEAGLQTTNRVALDAVNRGFDALTFKEGAMRLFEAGIEAKTGLIMGLPFDTLGDMKRTIDFVEDCGLGPSAELYPLSVLPGTDIRANAGVLGIEYRPEPPYWMRKTKWLSESDALRAFEYFEEACGVEAYEPEVPWFTDPCPGLKGCVDARVAGALEKAVRNPETLARTVTILCGADQASLAAVAKAGLRLREHDPLSVFRIVVECTRNLPEEGCAIAARDAFRTENHYHDRVRAFNFEFQDSFQARLFVLSSDERVIRECLDMDEPWFDLVIKPTDQLVTEYPECLESLPPLALDRSLLSFENLRQIVELYSGYENLVTTFGP